MQRKLIIEQHDINKNCDNLEQKFQYLLDAVDINDFFEKSLEFLSLFKSIIDNNSRIRENLKQNPAVMYVISLRNYQQHHEDKYKETIENNSHAVINDCIKVSSKSIFIANNTSFNGTSVANLEVSSGRTLNLDGGDTLERKFIIETSFNFSYKFQGKTYYGYTTNPPAPNFYQILRIATNDLITQMKKNNT